MTTTIYEVAYTDGGTVFFATDALAREYVVNLTPDQYVITPRSLFHN